MRLAELLRRGAFVETACAAVGVSPRTCRRWMAGGREPDADSLHARFVTAIETALAEAEMQVVDAILREIDRGNWRLAMRYAERRWPEHYGPASARRDAVGDSDVDEPTEREAEAAVEPASVLDQLAETRTMPARAARPGVSTPATPTTARNTDRPDDPPSTARERAREDRSEVAGGGLRLGAVGQ